MFKVRISTCANASRSTCAIIVRESGRSSIPEALVMEPGRRGVLVTPHARGMTAEFVEPAFSITGVFFLGAFQLRKR
jgi:hypothetical protein